MDHLTTMSLLEEVWRELKTESIQSAWYKAIFDHEWNLDEIECETVPDTVSYDPYPIEVNDVLAEYEVRILREVERMHREIMEEAELALAKANTKLQREFSEA